MSASRVLYDRATSVYNFRSYSMKNLASLVLALSIVGAGSVVFAQDASTTAPAASAPAAAPKKAAKHHKKAAHKKAAAKPAADATAPATK